MSKTKVSDVFEKGGITMKKCFYIGIIFFVVAVCPSIVYANSTLPVEMGSRNTLMGATQNKEEREIKSLGPKAEKDKKELEKKEVERERIEKEKVEKERIEKEKNEKSKQERIEETVIINFLNIVSGLTKEIDSTFDTGRTISGMTTSGTEVTIYVYKSQDNKENSTSLVVGGSGIFQQNIELGTGENVIRIVAKKENSQTIERSFTVRRKEIKIKLELESGIVLPGEGVMNPSVPTGMIKTLPLK